MTEIVERQPLSQTAIENLRAEVSDWESNEVASFLSKQAERKPAFFTLGDVPVKRTYTAADLAETPIEDIGLPAGTRSLVGLTRRCTARARGRCGRSPASALAKTPTSASNI